MCEFCVQHGEGQQWTLAVPTYSRELLDDDGRLDYLAHSANAFEQNVPVTMARLAWLSRTPLHGAAKPWLKRTMSLSF